MTMGIKISKKGCAIFSFYQLNIWRRCDLAFQKRGIMRVNFLRNENRSGQGMDTFELESEVSAKLHAFHARLKLGSLFLKSTLVRTFVDSRVTLGINFAPNNESLAVLGRCIVKYLVSEYLMARWPRLPYNILKTAMWGYCGSKVLARLGREWGIETSDKEVKISQDSTEDELRCILLEILSEAKNGKLVFKRIGWIPYHKPFLKDDYGEVAISRIVESIIGGIYLHYGFTDARVFINNHIISRYISMPSLFSFEQPTRELSVLCSRQNLEPPVSRLIAETGRCSISPLFIVGVYSGNEKLGEGHGSSLKEAKHTVAGASINALKAWYLYESKEFDRPSKTLENDKEVYIPVHIDCGEVIV
ncbi:hypothetical protein PCK2_000909 [Pneumocystis canis]|nr:hypothetical protein PCK2_000909 [Pneumocystis canis]